MLKKSGEKITAYINIIVSGREMPLGNTGNLFSRAGS
jgi:hypothetical protein